mgnify:CR=1 FL=1
MEEWCFQQQRGVASPAASACTSQYLFYRKRISPRFIDKATTKSTNPDTTRNHPHNTHTQGKIQGCRCTATLPNRPPSTLQMSQKEPLGSDKDLLRTSHQEVKQDTDRAWTPRWYLQEGTPLDCRHCPIPKILFSPGAM